MPADIRVRRSGTRGERALLHAVGVLCGCALIAVAACSREPGRRAVDTQPSEQPAAQTLPPPAVPVPETQPEEPPPTERSPEPPPVATQPAKPTSTYDSRPPYPVDLYVASPREEQPGWLKILGLVDDKNLATAGGRFPEQNRIHVETRNVSRIRIHVSHLPLSPTERVILQIDGQGMVLNRKRQFAVLERRPTGEWVILPEKDD